MKILDYIDGVRKAKGLTRRQFAEMQGDISVEALNKIFGMESEPHCYRLAKMLEVLNLPTFPPDWFEKEKKEHDDE